MGDISPSWKKGTKWSVEHNIYTEGWWTARRMKKITWVIASAFKDYMSTGWGLAGHLGCLHKIRNEKNILFERLYYDNGTMLVLLTSQGQMAAQLIEALCYKPEACGFNSQWGHWIFSIYLILPAALRPWGQLSLWQKWVPEIFLGVKGSWHVRQTTLPPFVS
jgi:hypothetical protein